MKRRAGRNDPCPCGSGKKFKKCCYAKDSNASIETDVASPLDERIKKLHKRMDNLSSSAGNPSASEKLDLLKDVNELLVDHSEQYVPKDLASSIQYLKGISQALRRDTDKCQNMYKIAIGKCVNLKNHRSKIDQDLYYEAQFWCRLAIRSFFAEVEGTTYAMRQVILWANDRGEFSLTAPEKTLLREKTYSYNVKRKKIESRGKFNGTLESFLLAFTILPRLVKPDYSIRLDDSGWENFQSLLKIRHKLTHPKTLLDTNVGTDELLRMLPRATKWYYQSYSALVEETGE